jgi:hypothetical protein
MVMLVMILMIGAKEITITDSGAVQGVRMLEW